MAQNPSDNNGDVMEMTAAEEQGELLPVPAASDITHSYIQQLDLTQFRNYSSRRFQFQPGPVVITGTNGIGKTNILEAISLFSPGRGLRRAALQDLQHLAPDDNAAPWTISAKINTPRGLQQIATCGVVSSKAAAAPLKRLSYVDGALLASNAKLAEYVSVIWLTPQMDGLFLDAPSARRKFMDRLVYYIDPAHAVRVLQYEHLVKERFALLQKQADPIWLDSVEAKMSELAVPIAASRLETIEHLSHIISESDSPFPKASLQIEGWVEDQLMLHPAVKVEQLLADMLAEKRKHDFYSKRTNIGTHRSDLQVTHLAKRMPADQCSTGEQKALLLSIILAEVKARTRWNTGSPIVLLDEVVAHLDEIRRAALIEEIIELKLQCFMTGTDPLLFSALKEEQALWLAF